MTMTTMARKTPTRTTMLPRLLILTNLLFFTAQCSNAYTPPSVTSRHIRWSPSLSSSTTSVDGAAASTTAKSATSTDQQDGEENITTRDLLSLDYIRSTLIRQEETIIFALIERAQFRQNDIVYKVGGVPGLGVPPGSVVSEDEEGELSFLDFMLTGTVRVVL